MPRPYGMTEDDVTTRSQLHGLGENGQQVMMTRNPTGGLGDDSNTGFYLLLAAVALVALPHIMKVK